MAWTRARITLAKGSCSGSLISSVRFNEFRGRAQPMDRRTTRQAGRRTGKPFKGRFRPDDYKVRLPVPSLGDELIASLSQSALRHGRRPSWIGSPSFRDCRRRLLGLKGGDVTQDLLGRHRNSTVTQAKVRSIPEPIDGSDIAKMPHYRLGLLQRRRPVLTPNELVACVRANSTPNM